MKKRKNTAAKIVALIALAAIIIGIVWTSILFIVSSMSSSNTQDLSAEDLQEILDSLPESEVTGTGTSVWSWEIQD